ncbi:MAG: class III signal peptide-containing protein [Methanobacterium sp.]
MDSKGQISAEYLLLVVVILIILGSVTIPLMGKSIDASNDVSWTSDAKVAVESVANAVDIVYANGPGAKRSIDIYIPQNGMALQTKGNNIYIVTALSGNTTKNVTASTGYNLATVSIPLSKNWHKIQVSWPIGSNINITAMN